MPDIEYLLVVNGYDPSEVIVFDTPSYETAFVGMTLDGQAVYEADAMVSYLMRTQGLNLEDAMDFVFNDTACAYIENKPIIIFGLNMTLGSKERDMANYGASENCIEWLRGEKEAVLSLSDPEWITVVTELAKKDSAVEIIDRSRHTLCAKLPLEYVSLRKPRKRKDTDEPKDNPSGHKAEEKAPRKKREVLRKRRLPSGS